MLTPTPDYVEMLKHYEGIRLLGSFDDAYSKFQKYVKEKTEKYDIPKEERKTIIRFIENEQKESLASVKAKTDIIPLYKKYFDTVNDFSNMLAKFVSEGNEIQHNVLCVKLRSLSREKILLLAFVYCHGFYGEWGRSETVENMLSINDKTAYLQDIEDTWKEMLEWTRISEYGIMYWAFTKMPSFTEQTIAKGMFLINHVIEVMGEN